MNILDINDGEYANFIREMQGEEQNLRKIIARGKASTLLHETRIDSGTLRRLMQRHNEAIAMLREFLEMHPEKSDLTQRGRTLTGSPK